MEENTQQEATQDGTTNRVGIETMQELISTIADVIQKEQCPVAVEMIFEDDPDARGIGFVVDMHDDTDMIGRYILNVIERDALMQALLTDEEAAAKDKQREATLAEILSLPSATFTTSIDDEAPDFAQSGVVTGKAVEHFIASGREFSDAVMDALQISPLCVRPYSELMANLLFLVKEAGWQHAEALDAFLSETSDIFELWCKISAINPEKMRRPKSVRLYLHDTEESPAEETATEQADGQQ